MRLTKVTAIVLTKKGQPVLDAQGKECSHTLECSIDLPIEHLGETVSTALQKAWNAGIDPVYHKVEITFGKIT